MDNNINFERVDFSNPSSILEYGQDIIDEIERVINNAIKNIDEEEAPNFTFLQKVNSLSGLSDKLDEVEVKRSKQNGGLSKFFNKIKSLMAGSDGNLELSYSEEYKRYIENIDEIVLDVSKMYENSKKDFDLFNNFIKSIKPYVEILQNIYDFGLQDRDDFEKEVIEAENNYTQNPDNSDYKREAIYKRQLLDIFSEKIYQIQKSKASINEIIIQWNMRQVNAIKQLTSYKNFLSLDKSVLKLNGTALIGAKKQKEEVELLKHLVKGVNDALIEGPKELNGVISDVNELTKDGNIKLETIAKIDDYLQTGVELLKQGSIEKKAFIEDSSRQLSIIQEHFKDFNLEVKEQLLLGIEEDNSQKKYTYQNPNIKKQDVV